MKIIAGEFGGRTILAPKGDATRPTTSQIRAAVFNICQNYITDAIFLDLFAGSGAMGLEALSRGAKSATFVENSREAVQIIRQNSKTLGVETQCHILQQDVVSALKSLKTSYNICYIDPPYGSDISQILSILDTSTLLTEEAHLFIEESTKTKLSFEGLTTLCLASSRRMGDTMLYCLRKGR